MTETSVYMGMRTRVALLALLLAAVLVTAQTAIPDTPAGQQFSAWLTAFNSGDRGTLLAFLQKNHPERAGQIDNEMGFRERTGGFEFKKTEESTPTRFAALVKERASDQFARVVVEVDASEPHVIKALNLAPVPTPNEFAVPRLNQADALAALRAEMAKQTVADHFSGAAIVVKDGKPVFSAAYGLADREKKTPNKLNTQFRIGSMNKMFTAVSVMQLVQAGKLKVSDTVGKILTDYPNQDVATKVTVHHLLTHTGGTGDIFTPEYEAHRLELKTLQDYVKLYGERDLQFEPGTKWEYSNYGFLLLGVLLERVSGKSYYDLVAENIYKVAGMTNSGSEPESVEVANRSKGYMRDQFEMVSNESTLPWRGTSAGGGYTTAADLMKFAGALMSNKLLKAATLAEATRPQFTTGDYGFGFQVGRPGEARTYGHGGGAPGMNAILRVYPELGQSVIVLCNLDSPSASRMGDWLHVRMPLK